MEIFKNTEYPKRSKDLKGKEEELIDLMWEVKEGKKHPSRAYKELCVLLNVRQRSEQLEALRGIERECDNQNPTHENIWRIANGALHDVALSLGDIKSEELEVNGNIHEK